MKPLTPAQSGEVAGGAIVVRPDDDAFEYDTDPSAKPQPIDIDFRPLPEPQ